MFWSIFIQTLIFIIVIVGAGQIIAGLLGTPVDEE